MSVAMDKRSARRRGLVVEIVGPAGAGKTTISSSLTQAAPGLQRGLRLRRWSLLPRYAASALSLLSILLERPQNGEKVTRQASALQTPTFQTWARMIYLQVLLYAVQRHAAQHNGVLVLDQGPVYKLAELRGFELEGSPGDGFQKWWSRMVEQWAGVLSLIVQLDASDDVLMQRIAMRDKAHAIKHASAREAGLYLARYRAAIQGISEHMSGAATMSGEQCPMRLHFMTDQWDVEQVVHQTLTTLDAQTERVAPSVQLDELRTQSSSVLGLRQGFIE
jgi:deoxyadenosine/deoxycytidine kinase